MDSPEELDGCIAIVGCAGRFPGAANVEDLWTNLCNGKESVEFFTDDALDPSIPKEIVSNDDYVPARGVLGDISGFDAEFFGIKPREAELMDPQQRLFLELCWEGLEDAGCVPGAANGLVGVFAGASSSTYYEKQLRDLADPRWPAQEWATRVGNDLDYLATSVAYRLNLLGPAISIRTACSTSLVAVCEAFYSLLDYRCDLALAGGVALQLPQQSGYLHLKGGILSADGHCRPFDADAGGTYFSSGAGVVVLKRLPDALEQGDRILAVIRGCATNNDGATKASFTAPNVDGQATAIALAQEVANVDPDTISYIEAHGTATEIGDPIEVEALTRAFRRKTRNTQFCGIGSIKSNFGHLDVAAGIAGLIKVTLALSRGRIPPSINYVKPNPNIDFKNSPFYVIDQATDWPTRGYPRRAGVSAFGTGGTNAHVVLEEAPASPPTSRSRDSQLLLVSARTTTALDAATRRLSQHVQEKTDLDLADLSYTLKTARKGFEYRRYFVCDVGEDIRCCIEDPAPTRCGGRRTIAQQPKVALMFPGQGSQYPDMGAGLYRRETVFRNAIDECSKALGSELENDLCALLYDATSPHQARELQLRNTAVAQPAIFAVEYALAKLWMHWGIRPSAMIGHSVGEFVAACLAGVFPLEDAIKLVAARGRLMQSMPMGKMLSIRAAAESVEPRLPHGVCLASINAPNLVVASGPEELIQVLKEQLDGDGVASRLLHTSHAFHSAMMDPAVAPFLQLVKTVPLAAPAMRIVSTVTGDELTADECQDPMYWARHLREPVRFSSGVDRLLDMQINVFLECGPRTTLATLARQHITDRNAQVAVPSMAEKMTAEAETEALSRAIGELWSCGVELDWRAYYDSEARRKVGLPAYPFERKRFWIDGSNNVQPVKTSSDSTPAEERENLSMKQSSSIADASQGRTAVLSEVVLQCLREASGIEVTDGEITFLELGFDSLSLTQVAAIVEKKTGATVSFREMLEDCPTPRTLAERLDAILPAEMFRSADVSEEQRTTSQNVMTLEAASTSPHRAVDSSNQRNDVHSLIEQQLDLMRQQLNVLRGAAVEVHAPASPEATPAAITASSWAREAAGPAAKDMQEGNAKPFGPSVRISKAAGNQLSLQQAEHLKAIIERYVARTGKSKTFTQSHRQYLADPRSVSGFHPIWKEMVYPIVCKGSKGAKVYDVDGNEYIDLTNGFGTIMFGHSPPFVTEALQKQLEDGFETGPQTPLAGRAAKLVCELTGQERAAFVNTGSEAVSAAIRLARTVTRRDRILTFSEAYHGIFDEVLVRPRLGANDRRSMPAVPGVPSSMVENTLVLPYGSLDALKQLDVEGKTFAAIIVEPVQAVHPSVQPREFLHALRGFADQHDICLIFDEVITGFRVHPAGGQGFFGVRADLGTYGKVAGGGMPIGIVAGKARFMDALDGGFWQYGDESRPETGVTFFAGTFVRHPMALAATCAVLEHLKQEGPTLQEGLNRKTDVLVTGLNSVFRQFSVPIHAEHFGSVARLVYDNDMPFVGLLYYLLREKGLHIWENRSIMMTTAHTDADIAVVNQLFSESISELQSSGFLPGLRAPTAGEEVASKPPVPGAILGRTPTGEPAWFKADPDRPGKYLQVETSLARNGVPVI